jgi:Secretion system C-terminal sorting domain
MRKVILSVFLVLVMASGLLAQTWTLQSVPLSGDLNSVWAVSTTVCWAVGPASVIVRTTNGGTNWVSAVGNFPAGTDLYTCSATSDLNCWVGAGDGSLYNTTNGGTTWTYYPLPAPAAQFIDVVHFFTPQIGFALGDPVGGQWCYYWTTNAGTNWNFYPGITAAGTEAGWNNSYCAIDTAHIWFGTNVSKIYKGGFRSGFTSGPTAALDSYGVAFFDNNNGTAIMYTGTAAAPNTNSTNGGASWTTTAFTPAQVGYGIKALANNFYGYGWMCVGGSATLGGKIYRTTNKGTSWTEQPTTLAAGKSFFAISMFNVNCGWAVTGTGGTGGTNAGVYKYNDVLNAINPLNTNTPTSFKLEQNYPNPFNPTTTINYSISKESNVTLKIYDILGNEVKSLVNEQQSVNNYTITTNFSNLTSGVYYYTLKAGDFTSTKKLMLIK